jgi:hypothetical protein
VVLAHVQLQVGHALGMRVVEGERGGAEGVTAADDDLLRDARDRGPHALGEQAAGGAGGRSGVDERRSLGQRPAARLDELVDGAEVHGEVGVGAGLRGRGEHGARDSHGAAEPARRDADAAPREARSREVPAGVADGHGGHAVEHDGAARNLGESARVPGRGVDGDAGRAQGDRDRR